jgi:predicted metal-dependent hydrolase
MKPPNSITPREKLDFGLEGDIPRHWFGGDPFKSRLFDAMSTLFPEGERFFIKSVRDWRDKVTDPELAREIKDFIRQEAQHGIVHTRYNERLKSQGINVDGLERFLRFLFDHIGRKFAPKIQNLADTTATEHLTAIMAECLFTNKDVMAQADPRVRAMYAWHAMEEVEHKAVAFDVLMTVAKCSYLRRAFSIFGVTIGFNLYSLVVTGMMLKVDGFGFWRRTGMMVKGVWWMFKPGGLYMPILGPYLSYLKRDFHPWQTGQMHSYGAWRDALDSTGDPVLAGEAVYSAAHQ